MDQLEIIAAIKRELVAISTDLAALRAENTRLTEERDAAQERLRMGKSLSESAYELVAEFDEYGSGDIAACIRELLKIKAEWKESRELHKARAEAAEKERGELKSQLERLKAEEHRLRGKTINQRERISYLEGATNHAAGTPLSVALASNAQLRAQLATAQQQVEAARGEGRMEALNDMSAAIRALRIEGE